MNAFDLLALPKRPLLNSEDVQSRYRALAVSNHPDVGGDSETHAALTSARDILLDDVRRVRELLRICGIEASSESTQVPAALADAGFEIEPVLKAAKELLERHGKEPALLAVAMLTEERIKMQEHLLSCQSKLSRLETEAIQALAKADQAWCTAGDDTAAIANAGLQASLATNTLVYLRRWQSQLSETLHELAVIDAMIP